MADIPFSHRLLLPVVALGVGAGPSGAPAQELPVHELAAPAATYPEGLGSLRGVRELPDGRVLVADGLGEALIVWRPGAGGDTLQNVGQGPGEYRIPDALHPLPDGGTLLVDLGNARLAWIGGDLEFGETEPIARPGPGGLRLLLPAGTDGNGRIYYEQRPPPGPGGPPDSATIRRLDPASGADEELGKRKLEEIALSTSGGANERSVSMRPRPLTPQDAWAPAPDGRVAVARVRGYHLEWIRPDGSVLRGPPVPFTPVRVRRADREEWVEAAASGGLAVMVEDDGAGPRTTFRRGGGGEAPDVSAYEWPDAKPPFPGNAVAVAPDGTAWVRRHLPAGEPPIFDLFDAGARRIARVRAPAGRSLVGFGPGVVYMRRTDDLGFEWLERYRLPEM